MGCSGSKGAVKKPATTQAKAPAVNRAGTAAPAGTAEEAKIAKQPTRASNIKTFDISAKDLELVKTEDAKTKATKLTFDLEYKEDHRKFLVNMTDGRNKYNRLPDSNTVDVALSVKDKESNTKLVEVIKFQFPAVVGKFSIKSNQPKGEDIKEYHDALVFAKTAVKNEYLSKNFVLDSVTFSSVLVANGATKRVVFFGSNLQDFNKVLVKADSQIAIEELSLCYCKGVDKDSIVAFIKEIAKNKDWVAKLKVLELQYNKLPNQTEVKKAMELAGLKATLSFKEVPKKKGKDGEDEGDEEEGEDEEDEDEDEEENEGDDEDEDEEDSDE